MYRSILIAVVLLAATGCVADGPTGPEEEPTYRVEVIAGLSQTGRQDEVLPEALVVRVVDGEGRPQPDISLRTRITEGDGAVSNPTMQTDTDGQARFTWQLGGGYRQILEVYVEAQPAVFAVARATALYRYRVPEAAGDGWPVAALDTTRVATLEIFEGIDAIRNEIYTKVHSLLIVQGGTLVFEAYFPGYTSEGEYIAFDRTTPHEVQSASKSFRSLLVGIALDRGFISSVDQPLTDFFPEHQALLTGEKAAITLDHVLTMSSGLHWNEGQIAYSAPQNTLRTMYSLPYSEWHPYVLARPLEFTPGSTFDYNTGASIMLNRVIMNATEMNLASFVRTYYLDLVESATRLPGVGNPLGSRSLPRDMARLGQVYLRGGMWKQNRVVSEAWIEKSTTPRFQPGDHAYGYQWWMQSLNTEQRSYPTIFASGNGGQFVFVVKDLDLVVVSTGGHFNAEAMHQMYPFLEQFILPAFESP